MRRIAAGLAALVVLSGAVPAQAQFFDPRLYQSRVYGERTQVLVLGTPHLANAGAGFDPAVLEPVLARLAAFAPTVIVIENLSGESVEALRDYKSIYPGTADTFGRHLMVTAALGQSGTGLEPAEAEAEARRLLAEWPESPTPAQRRRLAAVLAASGDLYSAIVQWWRLDPAERKPGDGLGRGLADHLERQARTRNESHLIGARLAVRLGLERVHPADDQSHADIVGPRIDRLMTFIQQPELQTIFTSEAFTRANASAGRLTSPEAAMEVYREVNSPAVGQRDADIQWLTMIDRPSPEGIGRTQTAAWEARNLRQVANIREISARAPGGRVLVIVGYSHKPWFDAYLSMMSDIELVDAAAILR